MGMPIANKISSFIKHEKQRRNDRAWCRIRYDVKSTEHSSSTSGCSTSRMRSSSLRTDKRSSYLNNRTNGSTGTHGPGSERQLKATHLMRAYRAAVLRWTSAAHFSGFPCHTTAEKAAVLFPCLTMYKGRTSGRGQGVCRVSGR